MGVIGLSDKPVSVPLHPLTLDQTPCECRGDLLIKSVGYLLISNLRKEPQGGKTREQKTCLSGCLHTGPSHRVLSRSAFRAGALSAVCNHGPRRPHSRGTAVRALYVGLHPRSRGTRVQQRVACGWDSAFGSRCNSGQRGWDFGIRPRLRRADAGACVHAVDEKARVVEPPSSTLNHSVHARLKTWRLMGVVSSDARHSTPSR